MKARYYIAGAVAVALAQTIVVGAMIRQRAERIRNGVEVVIESGMVDPRDLFRGHYVTLNLIVGDVIAGEIETDREFVNGDTVYVQLTLDEESGYWRAARLLHDQPAGQKPPFLRGVIANYPTDGMPIRIDFPFDRYFAEKDRALQLEEMRRDQKLGVVLALTEDGGGYVKGLMIDGRIVHDEPVW